DSLCPCCLRFDLTIRAVNPDPVGLRSIVLEPTTNINARLLFRDPSDELELPGRISARVSVVPIDPSKPASAMIRIIDRTGNEHDIFYNDISVSLLCPAYPSIDFPARHPGVAFDTTITFRNPVAHDIPITAARLAFGNRGFSVVNSSIPLPGVLKVGDTLLVTIRFNGTVANKSFIDTLLLDLPCGSVGTIVEAGTVSLGVDETIPGFSFDAITPNPLTGKANIRFSLGAAGTTTLVLYDETGRTVETLIDGRRESGTGSIIWDASALPNGIYYFRLTSGAWSTTQHVMVQH
ncbi:MAG: T9SS type A sorting domain-containing protein, partial [Bacteroidota bacterium]